MTLDWWLALCAWLPTPVLAWAASRIQGGWMSPGAVMSAAWALAAGVPLFLAPDLPVFPGAYGFVLAVVSVSVLASTMGASTELTARRLVRADQPLVWPQLTWKVYYACVGIGCAAPILLYGDATTATRASDLAELAMYTSMGRYGGEYEVPPMVRMLSASAYVAAAISGMVTASTPAPQRRWRRALLWMAPLIGTVVIHTEKAQLLYGLVLWSAGWAAGSGLARVASTGIRGRTVLIVLGGVLVLMAFFVGAQSMRMNRLAAGDIPFVLNHLRIYVVGHMPVFGYWWTVEYPRASTHGFGTNTFAGLAEIAGLLTRRSGIYDGTTGFTTSNIYTALRPLLEDFGIIGALGFVFALSFSAGLGWRLLQAGRCVGAPMVVAFTTYILWSPITSIFIYSTIIAVILAFAAWTWWVDASTACRRSPGIP